MTIPTSELPEGQGTLYEVVQIYKADLEELQANVEAALEAVKTNPSDPGALADFQAAQADYTTFKEFLSAVIKSYSDLDSTIVRNIG